MQSELSLVAMLVLPLLARLVYSSTSGCLLDWPTLEACTAECGRGHEGRGQGFLDFLPR